MQKIKVRYAGNKCAKCGREMKVGWDAFFEPKGKSLYCTVCEKDNQQSESGKMPKVSAIDIENNPIVEALKANNEILGAISIKFTVIVENLSALVDTMREKPAPKPTSKTKK